MYFLCTWKLPGSIFYPYSSKRLKPQIFFFFLHETNPQYETLPSLKHSLLVVSSHECNSVWKGHVVASQDGSQLCLSIMRTCFTTESFAFVPLLALISALEIKNLKPAGFK